MDHPGSEPLAILDSASSSSAKPEADNIPLLVVAASNPQTVVCNINLFPRVPHLLYCHCAAVFQQRFYIPPPNATLIKPTAKS